MDDGVPDIVSEEERTVLRGWHVWLIPALLLFVLLVPFTRAGLPATDAGLLLLDAEAMARVGAGGSSESAFNLWVVPLGYKWSVVLFSCLLTAGVGLIAHQLWGRDAPAAWWVASLWVVLPMTLTLIYQVGWFFYFNALAALLFGLFFALAAEQSSRWYGVVALYLLFVGLSGLWHWQSGLDPYQLLLPLWPDSDNLRLWLEGDAYQVGLVPLSLAALTAMVALPRREELAAKKVLFLVALGLLCMVLTLFDGPIMLYLVIATLAFVLAAGGLPTLDARYASFPVLLGLLAIAVLTIYPYLQVAWLPSNSYDLSISTASTISNSTTEWHLAPNTASSPTSTGLSTNSSAFWVVNWQYEYTETQNKLTILWQSTVPPTQDYSAFIHFLNEQGDIIAQADAWLLDDDEIPSSQWPQGYLGTQHYTAESANRPTHIRFGLYELETQERLLVNGETDHVLIEVRALTPPASLDLQSPLASQ